MKEKREKRVMMGYRKAKMLVRYCLCAIAIGLWTLLGCFGVAGEVVGTGDLQHREVSKIGKMSMMRPGVIRCERIFQSEASGALPMPTRIAN